MSEKLTKFLIAIVVMILIGIVGFSLWQSFTGNSSINQTFVFALMGISAFGLVKLVLVSGEKTPLSFQSGFLTLILIATPIGIILLLNNIGFDLFSAINVGGSASFNIQLEGNIIDWIEENIIVFLIGLSVLIIYKDRIIEWARRTF